MDNVTQVQEIKNASSLKIKFDCGLFNEYRS